MARAHPNGWLDWPPEEAPPCLRPEAAAALAMQLLRDSPESPERHAVWLFYVDGRLTLEQIAAGLGCTPKVVSVWLERFRTRLRRALLLQLLATRDFRAVDAVLEPATDDALAALSSAPVATPARVDALLDRVLGSARG